MAAFYCFLRIALALALKFVSWRADALLQKHESADIAADEIAKEANRVKPGDGAVSVMVRQLRAMEAAKRVEKLVGKHGKWDARESTLRRWRGAVSAIAGRKLPYFAGAVDATAAAAAALHFNGIPVWPLIQSFAASVGRVPAL